MNNLSLKLISALTLALVSNLANAIPVLQLGPDVVDVTNPDDVTGGDTGAFYVGDGDVSNGGDDTWYLSHDGSSFSFNAYNSGANNKDPENWTAYLVFAATPMSTTLGVDYFDLSVSDGTSSLGMVSSGVGAPPLLDPNSLAPHGIFDTYFEVYELTFDGASTLIGNTEPGGAGGGSAQGRFENIDVLFGNVDAGVSGIHIDMFTIDGAWDDASENLKLVTAFAPFSHDAQVSLSPVPVPATVWLFGTGLIGLAGIARRKV